MTPLQTLENRVSEMRDRLSELGGLEDFTDETRAELAALRRERQDNESKGNALRAAGDGPTPPVETPNDGVRTRTTPTSPCADCSNGATWARWWTASSKTFQLRRGQRGNAPTVRLGPWTGSLSMAEACWATGAVDVQGGRMSI